MQSFETGTIADISPADCARGLLDTVPPVMQFIRLGMRALRGRDLTVTQIRALSFINRNVKPSLSDSAFHIGLSLPAMSRLVDILVRKELLLRHTCPNDRRHVRLELTDEGRTVLDRAWQGSRIQLADTLQALSAEERSIVAEAMRVLRPLFDVSRTHGLPEARAAGPASGY